ncbi:MAG: Na+/H+ antiporter NhaC family protein [Campylobacterota bacterium]|nr:Na+/H+ antiporter NhaC family protein [Campylobacterota bacterium]
MEPTVLSLLPPLFAIIMALLTKRVFISLLSGIILGELILGDFSLMLSLETLWNRLLFLLDKAWILKTLAFAILVGSVMALLQISGAVAGLIHYVSERQKWINSPRSALVFTYLIGVLIFIESSITSLIAGGVGRPLCDKFGVSRAKLAYVCDSTSAPICSLIVLNGWGALILGLIVAQMGAEDSIALLLESLLFNFYAFAALSVTFMVIWFGLDTKAMKNAQVLQSADFDNVAGKLSDLLIPIGVMMATLFVTLYITGEGNILKGSGSSAIFYSMIVTLVLMLPLYLKEIGFKRWILSALDGGKSMLGITFILLLAFIIGDVTQTLQTGNYLASFAGEVMNPYYLGATVFVLSALMAFATGTSWGTFSIMIPIAIPLGLAMDMNVALLIGAVISGGVFGDHCSPISDTTIISSLAAGCDHIEHVKTQLPYALISGGIAFVLFIIFGIVLG